ncbi:MAG: hypothetical protein EA387_00970 [Nitriliruptor sp.]|nr:MAG: hypothetical protein EA387_00970 [Nitriliruptor sp.]
MNRTTPVESQRADQVRSEGHGSEGLDGYGERADDGGEPVPCPVNPQAAGGSSQATTSRRSDTRMRVKAIAHVGFRDAFPP